MVEVAMSEIVPFSFEGAQVRVVRDEANNPWFVAKDVCDALGHTNSRKAVADHVDGEDVTSRYTLTSGGKQAVACINESGMYSLVLSSRLDSAKRFKRWVTSEVLPSIRKTGAYVASAAPLPLQKVSPAERLATLALVSDLLVERAHLAPEFATMLLLRAAAAEELISPEVEKIYGSGLGTKYDDSACLNPTQLGEELGGISAIKVNKMLEARGLQRQDAKKVWRPTEEGKKYCANFPYGPMENDHAGLQLKWKPRVLALLRECLPESRATNTDTSTDALNDKNPDLLF